MDKYPPSLFEIDQVLEALEAEKKTALFMDEKGNLITISYVRDQFGGFFINGESFSWEECRAIVSEWLRRGWWHRVG